MKSSDKTILESLRKNECSHIPADQWLLVEKAVTDAGDIRQVRGMAQTIIFDAIRKGRFGSRSEAGRYAANQRWKGQGKKTVSSGKGSKQKYDFSPQDYKMVREAVPQISADDAKKLTQYLLDNNAFGDTSEMSTEEMGREFRMYLDEALGGGSSDDQGSMPDNAEDKAYERMGVSGRKINARKLSADDREELNQTAGIGRGELIDSLLDANPGAEVGAKAPKTPKATDIDARTATKIKEGNISDLSRLISRDLQSQGKEVPYNLVPYLDALRQMDSADDVYGVESGKSIIAYALSNMTSYKGPTARAVKAELKRRMTASKAPLIPASQFGLDDPTGTMDTVRAQDRMRGRAIDAQNAFFQD